MAVIASSTIRPQRGRWPVVARLVIAGPVVAEPVAARLCTSATA